MSYNKNSFFNMSTRQKSWLVIIVSLPVFIVYSRIVYKEYVLKEPLDRKKFELQFNLPENANNQENSNNSNDSKNNLNDDFEKEIKY
ncbi:hypothetical protein BB560_004624 [Smittium megazygosporum]|uniref:Uncharacterized protein n=1 Tax=Smittium megazygosporum TaxID=133381 RepID=A0A2T9Z8Q7_9FUNG|nr:hypothetical protein BB560_004624 [Smittium megazygosporum]